MKAKFSLFVAIFAGSVALYIGATTANVFLITVNLLNVIAQVSLCLYSNLHFQSREDKVKP